MDETPEQRLARLLMAQGDGSQVQPQALAQALSGAGPQAAGADLSNYAGLMDMFKGAKTNPETFDRMPASNNIEDRRPAQYTLGDEIRDEFMRMYYHEPKELMRNIWEQRIAGNAPRREFPPTPEENSNLARDAGIENIGQSEAAQQADKPNSLLDALRSLFGRKPPT